MDKSHGRCHDKMRNENKIDKAVRKKKLEKEFKKLIIIQEISEWDRKGEKKDKTKITEVG